MGQINGVQRTTDRKATKNLQKLAAKLNIELEQVLDLEALLWKQRSRSDWMELGNRNTKYFHSRAAARKKHTRIVGLKLIIESGVILRIN